MAEADLIGKVLRSIRKEKGWTLGDVSRRTGISVSTLSKVERSQLSLTYPKIALLAKGLEIDVDELFSSPSKTPGATQPKRTARRTITKKGEGDKIYTDTLNYEYLCADLLHKDGVPVVLEVTADSLAAYTEYYSHPGEEFIYVLEGATEFHTEDYAPIILYAGDSAYFDGGMKHAFVNVGEPRCKFVGIVFSTKGGASALSDRNVHHIQRLNGRGLTHPEARVPAKGPAKISIKRKEV